MIQLLNRIISRIKREPFELDSNLSVSYILLFLIGKIINLINGIIVFRRFTRCFIHPSSVLKCRKRITFGRNFSVDRWCYIDALSFEGIELGNNVSVGKFTSIECTGSLKHLGKGFKVGNNVGLGTRGHYGCAGGIVIGDDTIIGNNVSFHSENHVFNQPDIPIRMQGVTHSGIQVGNNCWIGAKVTILDGSSVGSGCVIAANSLVRGNFPDNCVIAGIPAKVIKSRINNLTDKKDENA